MMTRFIPFLLVVALTLALDSSIKAQNGESKSEELGDTTFQYGEYFEFDLTPARIDNESRRLRYSPQAVNLGPGNAAIHYYRACLQYYRQPNATRQKVSENRKRWFTSTIADFPLQEVEAFLIENDDLMQELQRGLRCEKCDWSESLATTNLNEAIQSDLSEIHLLQKMSFLLQLQARVAIKNQNYLSAINSIADGLKLSADVGKFPSEIAGLSAESIASVSLRSVIELVSIPGSPNQLSALRFLPNPIVDFFSTSIPISSGLKREPRFCSRQKPHNLRTTNGSSCSLKPWNNSTCYICTSMV